MSDGTLVNQTRNQMAVDYDNAKIFIWNNRYSKANLVNTTGAELTLVAGTVLGRISATGKIAVMKSASVDGSQLPIGILAENITLAIGANADLNFCVAGDVANEEVVFDGADTVLTEITLSTDDAITKIYGDMIADLGIRLVSGTELTGYDNA